MSINLFGGTASFCGLKETGFAFAPRTLCLQKEAGEPKPDQGSSLLDGHQGCPLKKKRGALRGRRQPEPPLGWVAESRRIAAREGAPSLL